MPYISKHTRAKLHTSLEINNAGELNFALTAMIENYRAMQGDSYKTFNEIIGVLECAKLEYYRRVVACYENDKLGKNGDVYAPTDPYVKIDNSIGFSPLAEETNGGLDGRKS